MMKRPGWIVSYLTFFIIMIFGNVLASGGVLAQEEAQEDSWAIYWYICGSDLETDHGYATSDIKELLQVALPDNVTVVIEAGGSLQWQNEVTDPEMIERYVYNSDGLDYVYEKPTTNMGDPETLADFLRFCKKRYPAKHTGVVFWNHGGGSIYGAEFDELYDKDSLTLSEFHEAFDSVYDLSVEEPPIDFIGFDCCLMATIDTAATFTDVAQYMVASEELIPGYGWDYTRWVGALAEDPSMDAKTLGIVICDTYLEANEELGCSEQTTLSVIDLKTMPELLKAFEEAGAEAFNNSLSDRNFLAQFTIAANSAENYGGNTDASGYGNHVDIRDLVTKGADLLPETGEKLIQQLEKSVVHKVHGQYRKESSGLSCYFSYNNNADEIEKYRDISTSLSLARLYKKFMEDTMQNFFTPFDLDSEMLAEHFPIHIEELEDIPITINEYGTALIEVNQELLNTIVSIVCEFGIYDQEADSYTWYCVDNDLQMDWENGVFGDNFRDVCGTIDGHMCYMELNHQGPDYNIYLVPILLNGEECQLHVVYDYNELTYKILGARHGIDDSGMSDRDLIQLQPGDTITTLLYVAYGDIDAEDALYPFEEFTVTEDTSFYDAMAGDGEFIMSFLLTDYQGNQLWSESVVFIVNGEHIETGYFQK